MVCRLGVLAHLDMPTIRGGREHRIGCPVTWQVHIGTFFASPSFWAVLVGRGSVRGGLETFWDELLGIKYYMFEKSLFFTKFGGS